MEHYGNFLEIDDNEYYIRKYSDENIPIYSKSLTSSPDIMKQIEKESLVIPITKHQNTFEKSINKYMNYIITFQIIIIIYAIYIVINLLH